MKIKIRVRKKYTPRYTTDGVQMIDGDMPKQPLRISQEKRRIHLDLPPVVPEETAMILRSHIAGHLYDNDVKGSAKRITVDLFRGQQPEAALAQIKRCLQNSLRYFPVTIEHV